MLASTRMHSGVPHATLNVCPLPSLSLRLPALPPHPSPPGCLWFRRDWHTATGIRDIVGFIYFVQFFWGLLPMLATVITFQQVPGRHYYLRRQTGARGGRGGGGGGKQAGVVAGWKVGAGESWQGRECCMAPGK